MCDQQDAALTETARNLEASWLVALAECHDLKGLFQFTLPIPSRSIGTEADPWKLLLGCKAGLTHINQEFQNFCLLAHTHTKVIPQARKDQVGDSAASGTLPTWNWVFLSMRPL